ncbi:MAG: hypothetical protein WCR08_13380 [Gammaproteobacteria bacterium]
MYVKKKYFFENVEKLYIYFDEKKIIIIFAAALPILYILRKLGAAQKLDYKVSSAKIRFYPSSIRLITTLEITNKSSENISIQGVTGVLKVNGIAAASIDQVITTLLRPGKNLVDLNAEIYLNSLSSLYANRFQVQFTFNGTLKAEGINIPIIYKYDV